MPDLGPLIAQGVGLIAAGAGGRWLWDLVTARSANRKTNAEGDKAQAEGAVLLIGSASDFAKDVVEEQRALRAEFTAYRQEREAKDREQEIKDRRQDQRNRAHERWDNVVYGKLNELGVPVDPPPPLYDDTVTA